MRDDGVLEVVALPRHEGHEQVLAESQLASSVDGPSARTSPAFTLSPSTNHGFWLRLVPWLERYELLQRVSPSSVVRASLTTISSP